MNYDETMRAQVEAMPRVRFVCERDWMFGPDNYSFGLMWDRNFAAQPGELVYQRALIFRLRFRLQFERRHLR